MKSKGVIKAMLSGIALLLSSLAATADVIEVCFPTAIYVYPGNETNYIALNGPYAGADGSNTPLGQLAELIPQNIIAPYPILTEGPEHCAEFVIDYSAEEQVAGVITNGPGGGEPVTVEEATMERVLSGSFTVGSPSPPVVPFADGVVSHDTFAIDMADCQSSSFRCNNVKISLGSEVVYSAAYPAGARSVLVPGDVGPNVVTIEWCNDVEVFGSWMYAGCYSDTKTITASAPSPVQFYTIFGETQQKLSSDGQSCNNSPYLLQLASFTAGTVCLTTPSSTSAADVPTRIACIGDGARCVAFPDVYEDIGPGQRTFIVDLKIADDPFAQQQSVTIVAANEEELARVLLKYFRRSIIIEAIDGCIINDCIAKSGWIEEEPSLGEYDDASDQFPSNATSKRLRKNMDAKNVKKYDSTEAHHIVPKGHLLATGARLVLSQVGIGIDEAANGVYLPKNQAAKDFIHPDLSDAVPHKGDTLRDEYVTKANARITSLPEPRSRIQVITALRLIARQLINGTF